MSAGDDWLSESIRSVVIDLVAKLPPQETLPEGILITAEEARAIGVIAIRKACPGLQVKVAPSGIDRIPNAARFHYRSPINPLRWPFTGEL